LLYDYVPVIPSVHKQLLVEGLVVVPVPMGPYIETGMPMFSAPGYMMGKHKLTRDVFHSALPIALKDHDIGPLIPHIGIPPNDLMIPVNTLKSSRKAMFSAGEVKAEKNPIACCTFIDWGVLPTPMLVCAELPLPCAGTGTAVLTNSLLVGMHWIDMVAGWAAIVVQFLLTRLSAPKPITDFLSSNVPGLVSGLVQLAGQEWGGYAGDAGIEIDLGGGTKLKVSRDGVDQLWSGSLQQQWGSDAANLQAEVTLREGRPGEDGLVGEGRIAANYTSEGTLEGQTDTMGRFSGRNDTPHIQAHPMAGLSPRSTEGNQLGEFTPEEAAREGIPWENLPWL